MQGMLILALSFGCAWLALVTCHERMLWPDRALQPALMENPTVATGMFQNALSFNQSLAFDTIRVTDMQGMLTIEARVEVARW